MKKLVALLLFLAMPLVAQTATPQQNMSAKERAFCSSGDWGGGDCERFLHGPAQVQQVGYDAQGGVVPPLPNTELALVLPQPKHAMLAAAMGQTGSGAPAVNLTWVASVTPGSTVNVYRCLGTNCTAFTQIATGIAAAGPYSDTTITAGSYSYQVVAVVNGAASAASNTFTIAVSPQPPTGLTGTVQQ